MPKAAPDAVARRIFDGLEAGEDEIFPDAMSAGFAAGWSTGTTKTLERANVALLAAGA